jgi:ABC-type multidrug transport system permease subunit
VTPLSGASLTLGKIVPAVLLGACETVLVLLAMVHVFEVPVAGDPWLLAGATTLFLFTSLALGLLISTLARTQLQAMMLTFAILLPSVLLSGFMFPRSSMPAPIHALTYAIPATYFIEVLRALVLRGATLPEVSHHLIPLAGIGVALAAVVTLRFRRGVA